LPDDSEFHRAAAEEPAHDLARVMWRIRSDWRVSWDGERKCWQVFHRRARRDRGRRFTDRSEALRYYLAEASLDGEELARWADVTGASLRLSG